MSSQTLLAIVTIANIAAGSLLLALSIYYQFWIAAPTREQVAATLDNANALLEQMQPPAGAEAGAGTPVEQSAVGDAAKSTLEGLATFAGSLKDLDPSTRGYLIALVFFALATVAASVGQIAA